jgi:nucleotide-binding universal stress UspA family protein
MKIEKILAGVDFGPATDSIMVYAASFASAANASVHLLHVLDYVVTPPAYLAPYIDEEKKIAEGNLAVMKKRLQEAGIAAGTETVIGRLYESFAASLKKTHADMLVLGFATHMFRRSSSEKLIKGLQIPMLVVRGEKAMTMRKGGVSIARVLCPTDFSDESLKALKTGTELCDLFSARLDVLHVVQDSAIKTIKMTGEREKALQELRESAQKKLDAFLRENCVQCTGTIEQGEPYEKISSFAQQNNIDLIVTGARGLGLIEGMLIGSVTDAVLKSSNCPVLVLH